MSFRFAGTALVLVLAISSMACSLSRKDGPSSGELTAAPPSQPAEASIDPGPADSPASDQPKAQDPVSSSSAPAPASAPAQAVEAQKSFEALTPEAVAAFLKIRGLSTAVPASLRGLRRPTEQQQKDALMAIDLSRKYLADFPGTEPCCEVQGVLVRMELVRSTRLVDDLKAEGMPQAEAESRYATLLKEDIELAEKIARECPLGSAGRREALDTLVSLYERTDTFEKLRSTAEILLKEFPTCESRPEVHLAVARSYLYTEKYAEAVSYLEDVIHAHAEDPEYVLYNASLLDALTATGNIEELEELAHLMIAEYPTRIPGISDSSYLKNQYEQQLCIAPFWVGFARMALGDNAGAREWFLKHIKQGTARQELAAAEGRFLGQDICNVAVEFRSKSLLELLDNYVGKVPRVDLDLGDFWATQKQTTLRESRGKVVALVFRMPENRRAEVFLQHIDKLARQHKDDLAAVTLGFRAGKANPTEDKVLLQKMRDDMKHLGVEMPAGFDPDREGQKFFREVYAVIGSPSFVVLNRKGEIAWYMADPRTLDRAIATRVIERLMAEPKA